MSEMRNTNEHAGGIENSAIGVAFESHPLRNDAPAPMLAPTSFNSIGSINSDSLNGAVFNGCISEISSDSIHGFEHDYTDAMKSYGVVYEKYQSYLMPQEQSLPHDYDMAAHPIVESSRLGCLNTELLDFTISADTVSDDDIENCGYAAWVRH